MKIFSSIITGGIKSFDKILLESNPLEVTSTLLFELIDEMESSKTRPWFDNESTSIGSI